jgi:hypothetical protein
VTPLLRARCAALIGLAVALGGCRSENPGASEEPGASVPSDFRPFTEATLVPLYAPPAGWSATALAFDPLRAGELWATLRQFPSGLACNTGAEKTACGALIGEIALVKDATGEPTMTLRRDGNAWHFMRRPTAIAFGDDGTLATCGEARTDNYEDEMVDFAGPVLWSSDQSIFGVKPLPDQNGTHLDMLHETPFCMGIAHDGEHAYFAFNGQAGAIDRNDFENPHSVGGEDHSDGEVTRYVTGELMRVPEVPSHVAFDGRERKLYIADTGHQRVVRLDVDSGMRGADVPALDPIEVHFAIDGATLEEVVAPGMLVAPSGIAVSEAFVFVTDNATGRISWFDHRGTPAGQFDTGLPAGSLAGIAIGPDGKLYLSDLLDGRAFRVEPRKKDGAPG